MKTFKKTLSITLTVLMLVSLVAVSFAGVGNAITGDAEPELASPQYTRYTYDYKKNGATWTDYFKGNNYVSNSDGTSPKSFIDANGLTFYSSSGYELKETTYQGSIGKAYIWDPDISLGGCTNQNKFFRLEANKVYRITVNYEFLGFDSTNTYGFFGLGVTSQSTPTAISGNLTVNALPGGRELKTADVGVKKSLTYIVDGNANSAATGCEWGTAYENPMAGKFVAFMSTTGSTTRVSSVVVDVFNSADVTAQGSKGVELGFDYGTADLYMPNDMALGNAILEIAQDPLNTGRGNVLKSTFSYGGNGSTVTLSIPSIEGFGGGLGAINNKKYDFGYGFKLVSGKTYRVSYDIYFEQGDEFLASLSYSIAKSTGISLAGNKGSQIGLSATNKSCTKATTGTGQWYTVEFEFTAADSGTATIADGYDKLALWFGFNNYTTDPIFYLDNIKVVDIAEESGNTVEYHTQGGTLDGKLPTDGKYVESVTVGTTYAMPTPVREGYVFAGWTKSWSVANGNISSTSDGYNIATPAHSSEIATKMFFVAEAGNTPYYAVWVPETYTIDYSTDSILTKTNSKTDGNFSQDGGKLKFNATSGSSRIYLGKNVGYDKHYFIYDNVKYKITLNVSSFSGTGTTYWVGAGIPNASWTAYLDYANFRKDSWNYGTGAFVFDIDAKDIYCAGYDNLPTALILGMNKGTIEISSITVEALGFDGGLVKDGGKLEYDHTTGVVTAIPDAGYTVDLDSVTVRDGRQYKGSVGSASVAGAATVAGGLKNLKTADGRFSYTLSGLDAATLAEELVFDAKFVEDTSKVSIRKETATATAGIRFKVSVSATTKANATEMGFIAIPTKLAGDFETALAGTDKKTAVVFDGTNDKYYTTDAEKTDYQMVLTGLTREGESVDLKDQQFAVVFYVKSAAGTDYTFVRSTTYNEVKDIYETNGYTGY